CRAAARASACSVSACACGVSGSSTAPSISTRTGRGSVLTACTWKDAPVSLPRLFTTTITPRGREAEVAGAGACTAHAESAAVIAGPHGRRGASHSPSTRVTCTSGLTGRETTGTSSAAISKLPVAPHARCGRSPAASPRAPPGKYRDTMVPPPSKRTARTPRSRSATVVATVVIPSLLTLGSPRLVGCVCAGGVLAGGEAGLGCGAVRGEGAGETALPLGVVCGGGCGCGACRGVG